MIIDRCLNDSDTVKKKFLAVYKRYQNLSKILIYGNKSTVSKQMTGKGQWHEIRVF